MKDTESAFSPEKKESIEKLKPRGIIAGMPGIGKTTFMEDFSGKLDVFDLDSNAYRKDLTQPDEKNPDWPNNYLDAIEEKTKETDLVLIGSDPDIVKELTARGHKITVVCPDETLAAEYEQRYVTRKNEPHMVKKFVDLFTTNEAQTKRFEGSEVKFLQAGEHLEDIIDLSGIH